MNRAKKIIALGAALLALGAGQAHAQVRALTLTSADATGAPGDVVTVPIQASMFVGSGDLQVLKFAVEFDGTMLTPLGATPGTAIGGWPAEDVAVDLLDGRVQISGITGSPITISEGLFFSLDFEVKEGVLDGSSTTFDLVGGAEKDPILLQADPNDDATRVKVFTTDGEFTVVGGAICAPGDALIDGESTVADAVVVLRIVTMLASADTPVEFCNADADQDGEITVGDAVVVLRTIVGLPVGRTASGGEVIARLERTADGSRLVLDGAAGAYGLSFGVEGDVAASLDRDAQGVSSYRGGFTRAAFASAMPLGGTVTVDLPGFDGTRVEDLRVVGADGSSLDVRFAGVPSAVARLGNYPNPFNPSTTIEYALPAAGYARLELFNARGERVAVLVDGQLPAGAGNVVWNGTDAHGRSVASGVYFAQFVTESGVARQRLVLLK